MKPVIGITGGIGSGKSTVARMFASLGAAVIDSDELIHEQYLSPEVQAALRSWWGERVFAADGRVDRGAIADIVFEQPAELERLQDFLYPRIDMQRRALQARYAADPSVRAIVLDVPKLFEVGLDSACDVVVFVDSDRDTRLQRLAARRGWSADDLERREKLLMPLDKKRGMADYVVANQSDADQLRGIVQGVFDRLLEDHAGSG